MKILHAISGISANAGGPSRSVTELAGALTGFNDVEVSLLRIPGADEVSFSSAVDDVRLKDRLVLRSSVPTEVTLIDFIAKFQIVHSHGLWVPFNHQVAKAGPALHIVSPRGMLEPWAMQNSKWKKQLAWWLYQKKDLQNATAFHATAESEAESIRRLGFKQPIAVIPNGVQFSEHLADRNKSSGKRTALFLSRIHPKKGLLLLLEAWARLMPQDWRLVIAGNDEGNHLSEVRTLAQRLAVTDSVEFVGPLFGAEKAQAFAHADLFVLPSFSENFGIVVAEALSYGVPVITTTGCPWESLHTHRCGWWVAPEVDALTASLSQALSKNPDELRAMGERGKNFARTEFHWPGIAEKMLGFYRWMVHADPQPSWVLTS